jgi:hypothetical protein
MRGVSCQQISVIGESKVLDVLELPFAGSLGTNIHDVAEPHLCGVSAGCYKFSCVCAGREGGDKRGPYSQRRKAQTFV